MKLYIKYMVSLRCKMIVKEALEKMGIHNAAVDLGIVDLQDELTEGQHYKLKQELSESGLELLDDKKQVLVDKIKDAIMEMISYSSDVPKTKYSDYISKKIKCNYTYLANVFAKTKGITIQQYIIIHKIEKVKKLLQNEDLNLTDISYKLNYSSVAHLSNQFKKITGLSPTYYKAHATTLNHLDPYRVENTEPVREMA